MCLLLLKSNGYYFFKQKGTLLCEPAIEVVRQGKDCQVWAVEKLSNRLIEMREHYEVHKQLIEKNKLLPVQGIDMVII